MNLKIDANYALEKVDAYLKEVEELLTKFSGEGLEEKSELNIRIKSFLKQAFEDSDEKINDLIGFPVGGRREPSEAEKQRRYINDLKKLKKHLIGYKEEISLILDSEFIRSKGLNENDEIEEDLPEILDDLFLLVNSCKESLGKDVSVSLKNDVKEYNRILHELNKLGYFKKFEPINEELEATGFMQLPPFEQAKVKEVIDNSQKLIHRLQKIIGTESVDTENDHTKTILELLFSRFHKVANQLKKRRKEGGKPKPTLEIENEYDVQDLLHALLRINFNDVRAEEPTPSRATKSSRIDFLLKNESIAVEVKFVRNDSDTRRISEELIVDIERYQAHPNVKKLFCFVYDPENKILNPAEIEELTGMREKIEVLVYVKPST